MQTPSTAAGRYGSVARLPANADERRLLELLEQAPADKLVTILKCVKGWQFEGQANLFNWTGVLDKLKTQLTTGLETVPRLLVVQYKAEDNEKKENTRDEEHERLWTEQVFEILRFSAILLENASNKHAYNAIESVTACLGARNERIVFEATRVLAALALPPQQHRHAVDPTTYADSPAAGNSILKRRLLQIVEAGGNSTINFDGLISSDVTMSDSSSRDEALYQFYRPTENGSAELVSIPLRLEQLSQCEEIDQLEPSSLHAPSRTQVAAVCEKLIAEYSVPLSNQFGLYTTIRAYASAQSRTKREVSVVERLHSFVVLFYVFSDALEVATLVENNPEMTRSLVELVRVENSATVPVGVRVAALQVLTALVFDRSGRGGGVGVLGRQSNVLSALGVVKGAPHGVFPSLVRFCLTELSSMGKCLRDGKSPDLNSGSVVSSETENDMEMSLAMAFVHATTDILSPKDAEILSLGVFRDVLNANDSKLYWIEAVLGLLNNVVSMQTGSAVLTENGVVPALLHVISSPSASPFHTSLITLCVQALETTVNTYAGAASLYRELNGVGIVIDRMSVEIAQQQEGAQPHVKKSETKTVLIVALLVLLSVSFHSQGVMSAGATSRVIRDGSSLSKALITILSNIDSFGPVVFAQASIVVSDIINNDPSSVNQVHSGGIADAFLKTLTRWDRSELHPTKCLPPSAELVMAVPPVLSALCLTTAHADKVGKFKPLAFLLDMFALPGYAGDQGDYLHGDIASITGSGIFEMMRQVSGFQTAAIQACVEAGKKIIRFGESLSNEENSETSNSSYGTLLRMTTHFCDLLEPILTKSEHAVGFADNGGVQCLLKMYRLMLPSASTFLSSLQFTRDKSSASTILTHQPAAQSITLALRSFATQQPATMLSALISEVGSGLDRMRDGRAAVDSVARLSSDEIDGLFSSLSDVEMSELFTGVSVQKVRVIGEYLRALAFVEWLSGILVWTMQTAQNHLHSRRWFTEFSSRSNQQTLSRLFTVDRSIQEERAKLVSTHRRPTSQKNADASAMEDEPEELVTSEGANFKSDKSITGVWKICSLLLLRFSIVVRSLMVCMSKSFLVDSMQHRRGDDGVHQFAPHASSLAEFLAETLKGQIQHVLRTEQAPLDPFVKKYYLVFLLETIIQVIFDARKKQPNTLLVAKIFDDDQNSNVVTAMISCLMTQTSSSKSDSSVVTRMDETAFKVAASALQRLADIDSLKASPFTASLVLNEDLASSSDGSPFDFHKLALKLHGACVEVVKDAWSVLQPNGVSSNSHALEIVGIVVAILKNRLDTENSSGTASRSDRDVSRGRDFPFGRIHGTGVDRDDFFHALFGTRPSRSRRETSRTFEVDPAAVDSLVAMGFQRSRVEHAIRRVRLNDVEVAMEWLLSHPDEEIEEKTADSGDESDGQSSSMTDTNVESTNANELSDKEKQLFDSYKVLRESFEEHCIALIRHQDRSAEPKSEGMYSQKDFVYALAEHFSVLSGRSEEERKTVLARVNVALQGAFQGQTNDRFVMMLSHMLALLLRMDDGAVEVLLQQTPSCVDAVVSYLMTSDAQQRESTAALLLVLDSLEGKKRPQTEVGVNADDEKEESSALTRPVREQLVSLCISLMKSTNLDKITAHAIWQLLVKLTLDYDLANRLYSNGGVDVLLNIRPTAVFTGYGELTSIILAQMLESPELLEHTMEEKILQAMSKLADRFGSPNQMRITPRALLMEVATVAARNEKIFLRALQSSVVVRKSESGRTYVMPKSTTRNDAAPARDASETTGPVTEESGEKKHQGRSLKGHRQHAQALVQRIVSKIYEKWDEERKSPQTTSFGDNVEEDSERLSAELCVGTYLQFLVRLVTLFPACGTALTKIKAPNSTSDGELFVHLALREFLPSTELCRFASIRRSLKSASSVDGVTMPPTTGGLTTRTKYRVMNAHKLLVAIGSQSGEGSKTIVNELVQLFQDWPKGFCHSSDADMSIADESALSAVHAWSALIMSILWPRGSTKSFSWDKVVLGGGLAGKYSLVTLLANTLRRIDLSHPLAHVTCSMLLRPLATLTRSFVTHRVKRLLKKKNASLAHDEEAQEPDAANAPSTDPSSVQPSASVVQSTETDLEPPVHLGGDDDDVMMNSPVSAHEHDIHDTNDASDDESDRSSESHHSIDEGRQAQEDRDDDEEEDEEDDDDEEDEDEDDEEQDEDEDDEEDMEDEDSDVRLQMVRSMRRTYDNASRGRSNRGWGALDGEFAPDALDEVDEEEFSYLNMLDDESVYTDEQRRRQRHIRTRSRSSDHAEPSHTGGSLQRIRSLVDVFSLDGGAHDPQAGVFAFGDDDEDEDDPDTAFRSVPHIRNETSSAATELGAVGSVLLQVLESRGNEDDDFIFQTVDVGSSRRAVREQSGRGQSGREAEGSIGHPLLRSSGPNDVNQDTRGVHRFAVPRHSSSLLRELQELTEQVHTQLPFSFGGRSLIGRDALRSGRNRPPSRNRLSAVSNLLSEFSLDIPTSQTGFGQSRGTRTSAVRRDRDILGSSRGFRDVGAGSAGGSNVDVRSVATRLEQHINQLYVEEDRATANPIAEPVASADSLGTPPPSVGGEHAEESVGDAPAPSQGAARNSEVTVSDSSRNSVGNDSLVSGDTSVNAVDHNTSEAVSDTASVIALASTLGESSLRSPNDDAGSETEMSTSPVLTAASASASDIDTVTTLPPPAPVTNSSGDMMSFTLDLSSFQPSTNAPPPPHRSNEYEEEMKGDDSEQDSAVPSDGLVCPDGVDPDVFASLPPDMQAEIVAQHAPAPAPTTSAPAGGSTEGLSQLEIDMANSSFDRETLEALPPDIRAEVLANERREREAAARAAETPADISRAEEMDNASFVASLAPGLREEILTTCDDAFLQTLPSQVQAEAMVLRERVAFRTTYRETEERGSRGGDENAGDIFRRPTLRRMLTSHGPEVFSRRSGRRYGEGSSRRGREDGHSRPGIMRVHRDESEDESDRILEDRLVKAVIRLLFMAQSTVQNRVFQRLIGNVCLYPLTRRTIRKNMLQVLTQPLSRPLISSNEKDDEFPPKHLYGCGNGSNWTSATEDRVHSEVLSRVLTVMVSLVKHNARFAVDMLNAHGMKRSASGHSGLNESENGVSVLIELLDSPIVYRSGTLVDTLLELIERVLAPLDRLAKKPEVKEEQKEEDEASNADSSEWVSVPSVELDAQRMVQIVGVLCLDICTSQMQERTVHILKLLDRVPSNKKIILDALVRQGREIASSDKCSAGVSQALESSAVLRSAQDEIKLLRLLHTLSDVCGTTIEFNECCAVIGLNPLWDALSQSLEEARTLSALEGTEVGSTRRVSDARGGSATEQAPRSDEDQGESMIIEGKSAGASCAMAALLARFLPMVEAFFVVNARDAASLSLSVPDSAEREEAVVNALRVGGFDGAESMLQVGSSDSAPRKLDLHRLSSAASEGGESMRLANFVEANRVLLNLLVREKPALLDSSLAALIKMPRCRAFVDFDNKRTYFQSAMKKLRQTALRSHVGSSSVRISVRRDHIFEDSYYALRMRSGTELRRKLHISFTGEEGIDAGGVTREWYVILAREIFNPNYVLFTSAADSPTFQPNPLSYVNKDHLSYFEFVGKVIGKAVADGQLLDAHFTRSFYKHILQLPISYHDMEAIDPEYYRNLHSILDNPIEDLGLELTFSAEQSNFGRMEIVDLIPNGRNIAVTDENKMEYVQLVTHHRMATGIRQQIDAFLKGFHQLAPPELISIFNENELELLISGMPEIDIDDLKANTEYANYKPTDSVIRWFWNVLYTINHEERALFLQFVTGTSKVPLEGFKALEGMRGTQKFNIHKAFGNPNALPSAHTCFNQLDLPEYESEEKLRQCLLLAIREGSEGFGFG
ncbi:hypothetical protein Poli38472_009658 [Pythium oligandrum]|uniref:HECT-type E3 ubiquitin transferase n=1 Tax=Pythium oligandrum TaxID=41045 RepID=A0A8K1CG71_PYTOL|nr:hypothetical protein Poli38472_009658 [Pythium oligandrum]|eukprot:TMW62165.1 hypothetical protein Poli38472_009658 [Pythium oligandrum]